MAPGDGFAHVDSDRPHGERHCYTGWPTLGPVWPRDVMYGFEWPKNFRPHWMDIK